MYTLTDTHQIACHGTSFPSIIAAKTYARRLQSLGLCQTYSIGYYSEKGHVEVYNSKSANI